jgi:hypothetical protein
MAVQVFAHKTQITGGARGCRRGRRVAVLAALAAIAAGASLAAAAPAGAVLGLQVYQGTSVDDTWPTKLARADCPASKHIVGGGGRVLGRSDVRLTALMPISISEQPDPALPDRFHAIAQAPSLSQSGNAWRVVAYAICADRNFLDDRNYQIVPDANHLSSSAQFQRSAAVCPAGTVAYSAGANIESPNGRVGLQLNRTSGPQDISRATAREDTGYTGSWKVRSYAVCAGSSGSMHFEDTIAPGAFAEHRCGGSYQLHGPGGGGGLTDGGPSWLTRIEPDTLHKKVTVQLTAPLSPSIGGMVAHATCAL